MLQILGNFKGMGCPESLSLYDFYVFRRLVGKRLVTSDP